jgi:hypothetical protein
MKELKRKKIRLTRKDIKRFYVSKMQCEGEKTLLKKILRERENKPHRNCRFNEVSLLKTFKTFAKEIRLWRKITQVSW